MVEFMYDFDCDEFYFMEMNMCFQIEYLVIEKLVNIDIVGVQFDIVVGGLIVGFQIEESGFVIEVCVNVERFEIGGDGMLSFWLDLGNVICCDYVDIEGVDIFLVIDDGILVLFFYDSMVVQVIVYEKDCDVVFDKFVEFLRGICIEGVGMNILFLFCIFDDLEFCCNEYDMVYMVCLFVCFDL